MKVLSHMGDRFAPRIEEAVPGVEIVAIPADGEVPEGAEGEVLLTLVWGTPNLPAVLERGVRWVHVIGTGVERFPMHEIGEQTLTCSRGASAVPIAEWVLAVMLAFEKQLPDSWATDASVRWNNASLGGLADRTLGLIGLGGIGEAIARRALAFDMRVRARRRTEAPSAVAGVELAPSLPDLLASADHLVVAAPATPATRHLLEADAFASMKRGVHLVNIARGALVDQDALRVALDDGIVARASLDTVEPEPLPDGHWMYTHPGVRLSPHISWSMPGAWDVMIDNFVDNLRRYRAGEPLAGIVDLAEGY